MRGVNPEVFQQNKSQYVNFCASRRHAESTDDQQVIVTMLAAYISEQDPT